MNQSKTKALCTISAFVLAVMACSIALGQTPTTKDPMAPFQPFVGQWEVQHTLYGKPGATPEVFKGTADIYFVSDGTVLVVEESTPDKRYFFVGFHAYDKDSGKYLNWTASSSIVLAWSEGKWDGTNEVFQTRRIDPRTGQIDTLIGKGIWKIVNSDKNVFTAFRLQPDGTEIPFKEEVYIRVKN